MATVAFSGLFIHVLKMFGLFSPIHLLSIFTLYSLWNAVSQADAAISPAIAAQ